MSAAQPFRWDGAAKVMVPLRPTLAAQTYDAGEVYPLAPLLPRSDKSHDHYFACVQEAWENLPDAAGQRFATSEHLRKWCLIKSGYHDERTIVAASRAEALRLASFVKPMDEYAVVVVSGAAVTVYTAKSQSMKAMGRDAFQRSKEAVLEILAEMIRVTPEALRSAA